MNYQDLIFSQVKERFKQDGVTIDEINFLIDLSEPQIKGFMTAFEKDEKKIHDIISMTEMSIIKRLFISKVLKMFKKEHSEKTIKSIYVGLKLDENQYQIYINTFQDEQPINFKF